jgi:3-oxoacyl-[acyl-carrier-protein] synthase-1
MQDDNEAGLLPPHLCGERDPALPPLNVAQPGARLGRPIRYALSNSFAFGGSNAALVFGRAA